MDHNNKQASKQGKKVGQGGFAVQVVVVVVGWCLRAPPPTWLQLHFVLKQTVIRRWRGIWVARKLLWWWGYHWQLRQRRWRWWLGCCRPARDHCKMLLWTTARSSRRHPLCLEAFIPMTSSSQTDSSAYVAPVVVVFDIHMIDLLATGVWSVKVPFAAFQVTLDACCSQCCTPLG